MCTDFFKREGEETTFSTFYRGGGGIFPKMRFPHKTTKVDFRPKAARSAENFSDFCKKKGEAYSGVSNKRTGYAYLFSEKIPPCTLLLETCTLIIFLL